MATSIKYSSQIARPQGAHENGALSRHASFPIAIVEQAGGHVLVCDGVGRTTGNEPMSILFADSSTSKRCKTMREQVHFKVESRQRNLCRQLKFEVTTHGLVCDVEIFNAQTHRQTRAQTDER